MAEPLRLEIIVDDKGTPVVRQFTSAVDKMGQEVGKGAAGLHQATQASAGLSLSLGSVIKGAAGFALLSEGIALFKGGISDALTSVVSFQTAMANANTLLIGQVPLQQRLRAELLQLPPILGSSTELSRGLYEALSAGVKPAEAVQFVGVAATLAKAGLASLDTATIALTKTLQGYGMQTKDATKVSDILFQTVNLGQGSLQNFASAFPLIIQQSVQLGVPLQEAAATLATLSTAFPSAAEAATAYRSALNAVSENSAKFASVGLDVKKIIAEEGLTGLFVRLSEVTGGSAQKLNEFIGRIEGQNAVLAITGPLLAKHRDNVQQMADTTGLSAKALGEQSVTLDAAFKGLMGTIDRWAQQKAPPILQALTDFLNAMPGLADRGVIGLEKTQDAMQRLATSAATGIGLEPVVAQLDAFDAGMLETLIDIGSWIGGLFAAGSALDTFTTRVQTNTQALEFQWERADQVKTTEQQLEETLLASGMAWDLTSAGIAHFTQETQAANEAVAALRTKIANELTTDISSLNLIIKDLRVGDVPKIIDPAIIDANVTAAAAALERLRQAGGISLLELRQSVLALEEALIVRLGAVPPRLQPIFEAIRSHGVETAEGIQASFEASGVRTQEALQRTAVLALADFDRMLQSGKLGPTQIVEEWLKNLKRLDQAGFQTLPPLVTELMGRVKETFRKAGVELPQFLRDGFNQLRTDGKNAFGDIVDATGKAKTAFKDFAIPGAGVAETLEAVTEATIRYGVNAKNHLTAETLKAAAAYGFMSKQAAESGQAIDDAGKKNKEAAKSWHDMGASASDARVTILGFMTKFPEDAAGMAQEVMRLQRSIGDLINDTQNLALSFSGFDEKGLPAFMSFANNQTNEWRQAITILTAKLEEQSIATLMAAGATRELAEMQVYGIQTAQGLAAAYDLLGAESSTTLEAMAEEAKRAFDAIAASGSSSAEHLREIWIENVLPRIVDAYGDTSSKALNAMQRYGDAVTGQARQTFGSITDMAQASIVRIETVSLKVAGTITNAFANAAAAAARLGDFQDRSPGAVASLSDLFQQPGAPVTAPLSLIPIRRQGGGPVSLGRPYTVGERGPELFVPRQSGAIIPTGSSWPSITVHAPITVSLLSATRLEAQKVADSLAEAINEGIRRGTIHGSLRAA